MALIKVRARGQQGSNVSQDLGLLAFDVARTDNRAAYNLANQFVDQFEDETGIDVKTNTAVVSERVISATPTAGISAPITQFRWAKTGGTVYATWNFQGSTDNSNWTTLDTGYSMSSIGSGNGVWGSWASFTNTTNYPYYRFYKTNGAQGGGYHTDLQFRRADGTEITDWKDTSYITSSGTSGTFTPANLIDNDTLTIGFHTDSSGAGTTVNFNFSSAVTNVVSATGSYTGATQTATSSVSDMSIVVMYQDTSGTATLNTDLIAEVSADGGSNYTTVTLAQAPALTNSIKVAKSNQVSVTAGTQPKYRISFANQSDGVKITEISGVALQY